MRVKAYFTIEAAFIVSALLIIIAQTIKLDFYLHDCLVLKTSTIISNIRFNNAENYYYDISNNKINVNEMLQGPVLGDSPDFLNKTESQINSTVKSYFYSSVIYNEVTFEPFSRDSIELDLDNHGDMVRFGESLKRLTGGL